MSDNKTDFIYYLKNVRGLSKSSISKYATQSHNRIQKDLGISFYSIDSMPKLNRLLQDVKLLEQKMEKDPRRMYSSAISNYIKFKAYQVENQYLLEESEYNYAIEYQLKLNIEDVPNDSFIESKEPAVLKENTRKIYHRDRRVAAQAIKRNNFTCQIDSTHAGFISKVTQRNYVEAHHIIPISTQALFTYSIDSVPNIATLCPVCHRQIYYGLENDKVELLERLWDKNHEGIHQTGIEINFSEVKELYMT